jgi:two-component system, OmpR family, KDP operon response regulator KdpE
VKEKVLVIDDELAIRRLLAAGLSAERFAIVECATAQEGLHSIAVDAPDVILLDLGLPDKDGVEVVKEIRSFSRIPIIILSARDQDASKIEALDAGADDYLTKPFSVPELEARMRVALRRINKTEEHPLFKVGSLTVDFAKRIVLRGDEEIHLTPIEFKLLSLLVRYQGRVLTHKQILTEIWGSAYARQTQYLRVFMGALRKKLELDPAQPEFLTTEPGIGYRLKVE